MSGGRPPASAAGSRGLRSASPAVGGAADPLGRDESVFGGPPTRAAEARPPRFGVLSAGARVRPDSPGAAQGAPAAGAAAGGSGAQSAAPSAGTGADAPAGARSGAGAPAGVFVPRPRQEYIDAFDAFDDERFGGANPPPGGGDGGSEPDEADGGIPGPRRAKGGKGRAFAGVAAAAVTTVLAVVVAGQVADGGRDGSESSAATGAPRHDAYDATRGGSRQTPAEPPQAPTSYEGRMAAPYELSSHLTGSGDFQAVGGHEKAPGKGQVVRYRVDVEQGLPLDGKLFAEAVHKTLNDDRSWGHGGTRTFERVAGREADWVITLASPGTTAKWCARSGLDTTVDNVSCDSASTERVMINAYRWAQGAETYGHDRMFAYRQMLINHEVGHRLGHNHEKCPKQGAPAPVMLQQTKYLTTDGVTCKPNSWPFPAS
ncbi:DUF3152 domain-containing protein [Streptomyces pathocidini]|uniref:DUF3152 domain-containing protein n=1 Tax=Streptomyces pathocidini TaxID=1650571 RepID=A0ABW7UMU0_9ACTN